MRNYQFCPYCGAQNSLKACTESEYQCNNCERLLWDNPRATVAVILRNDQGELAYAERAIEPNKGKFDFPGGFVEYNEDMYQACARELEEEMGITVDTESLHIITAYTLEYLPGVSVMDMIIVADRWQGDIQAQDDVAAIAWKPIEFIDSEQFAPPYPGLVEKLRSYLKK